MRYAPFMIVLIGSFGCAPSHQRRSFDIEVHARIDNGKDLAGVEIKSGPKRLGMTSARGRLVVRVDAADGGVVVLDHECPKGFTSKRNEHTLPLRALTGAEVTKVSVDIECKPDLREAAIVVKTNMAGVPVLVDNRRAGVTNEFGVAHIAMTTPPNKHFYVALDTSKNPKLWPRNPVAQFAMADRDELFLVNESFEVIEDAPVVKRKRRRRRNVEAEEVKRPTKLKGSKTWGTIKRPTKASAL